jgi:ADP-ribose pyrophosphatase YjhB (NUDIX family)
VPGDFLKVGVHPVYSIAREVREELGLELEVVEGPSLPALHTYEPDGACVLAIT